MEGLSDEQIEEFREAFSVFDPENKGYIQTKELGNVLRSLGIYITNEEKNEYIEKYVQGIEDNIYFHDFLKIIFQKISDTKVDDELFEAFSLFDPDKKKEIDIEQFEQEFKEYLPEIDEKEVKEICQYLKHPNTNTINIQEAVQELTSKVKSHLK